MTDPQRIDQASTPIATPAASSKLTTPPGTEKELQSINEELVTVNNELKSKIDALTRANEDINNLLNSVAVGIIFLDQRLQIKRFNPQAQQVVHLIETDVGRPLQHLATNLAYDTLVEDCRTVLATQQVQAHEAHTRPTENDPDERWYTVRIQPYTTLDGAADGLVLTFADITAQKRMQAQIEHLRQEEVRALVDNNPDLVVRFDRELRHRYVNPAVTKITGIPHETYIGKTNRDLGMPEEAVAQWDEAIIKVFETGEQNRLEFGYEALNGPRYFQARLTPEHDDQGEVKTVLSVVRDITEIKAMERALREREALLGTTGEMAHVGGWELETGAQGPSWTEQTYHIHGLPLTHTPTLDEAIAFFHPEERATLREAVERAFETGEPYDLELRFITAQGEARWVHTQGQPHMVNGKIVKLKGTIQDITERKRAEAALRESEGRLRSILHYAPVVIYLKDLDQRFTLVNRAFEEAFNRSEDEIIGATSADLVSAEAAAEHEANDVQVIQSGKPQQFEETAIQADGQEHTVLSIKFPMYNAAGELIGVGGISTDITTRKQADAALAWRAEADRAIATLAAALLDPAPIDDIAYQVLAYARELTTSTFGYVGYIDRETGYLICPTMTRDIWEVCQVPDKDFVFDTFGGLWGWVLDHKQSLMTNHPPDDPRSSGTPGGHLPIKKFLSAPVLIGQELAGQIALANPARDYTARDLVLVERLAALYALALQRIQVDKEMQRYAADLERSNQELEQFGFVISHDLQEPVRIVKGYLELLEKHSRDRLDDKANRYLDFAVDGAVRMQQMIRALLDLSRVTTRGEAFAPTDTGAVLESVLAMLGRATEEAGAEITHTHMPTVMADAAQLAQVFQNLIANALKFRREDIPAHIHIAATAQDDVWRFSIADNGIGLDPDQADRIFQIFQRLHTAEEYPGLGIGLALCERIVARHGGRIWVESTPGEGSTFIFTLPQKARTPT